MDNYLVLGNPIVQSKSPEIHNAFAKQYNESISYDKLFIPIDEFEDVLQSLILQGIKGANVTVPFKEKALLCCHVLSDRAKKAGAVNTLSFLETGEIVGDNTDGLGLVADLKRHDILLENKSILIIGAGGASKGVLLPLLDENPQAITIANRTKLKAVALANDYASSVSAVGFDELNQPLFDLVINATSASLSGELPNISAIIFKNKPVVYDMVYGKGTTVFNQWAVNEGAHSVIDGLGMLVSQAAESFAIWRGVRPNVTPILDKLRQELT